MINHSGLANAGFKSRLVRAVATFALIAMSAGSADATPPEPTGHPTSCWMYQWNDVMSWWYGYAGVCYYSGGRAQYFRYDGTYENR